MLKQFDANGDGWLNTEERAKARAYVKANPGGRGGYGRGRPGGGMGPGGDMGGPPDGGGGFRRDSGGRPGGMGGPGGGPGGGRGNREAPKAGLKVAPSDVKSYPDAKLYDPTVLRTVFVDFEEKDWETELAEFHGTDVDVAAKVTVDGKTYPNVGLRFRGNSSYNMIPNGYKKSFNVDFGLADKKQRLYGHKTLNLLNSNGDPSMMRSTLYSRIAGESIPIAKTNFVRVVVNGEDWGLFSNVQQVDKTFLKENFGGDDKGIRWKTPGSPQGRASLAYVGDDAAAYKRSYDIKTDDPKEAAVGWSALVDLTKTLNETPAAELPSKIEPILDVAGALRFLALENALVNSDGYWVRTSDYNLYRDSKGKFHVFPHDFNETFLPEGGPGGGPGGMGGRRGPGGFGPGDGGGFGPPPDDMFNGGGPGGPPPGGMERGGGGSNLGPTPLMDEKDANKPLISKLLAVPKYRAMYLKDVSEIATTWLDWNRIAPIVKGYDTLINPTVKADTKKLDSYEAYLAGTGLTTSTARGRTPNLKAFVEGRRKMLLADKAVTTVKP